MGCGKVFFSLAFLSLFLNTAYAATIYGNIYDLSLKKLSGAKVEINTTPQQFLVSEDGSYSFEIRNGFYTITAQAGESGFFLSESRNVSVKDNGSYVIDLILFPNLDDEFEEPEIDGLDEKKSLVPLFVLVSLLIAGIMLFLAFRRKKSERINVSRNAAKEIEAGYEKNLDDIIKIIRDEDGRATQKDIRKRMPYSEAKVSLMIAELEHKGVIEKIKKGRGNIIVLKKK